MDDATQSADEPRRSGRERKQVVSMYAEAEIEAKEAAVAGRKKATTSRKSTRRNNTSSRKRQADEAEDETDDEDEHYSSSDEESTASFDDQVLSDCEVEHNSLKDKPIVRRSRDWNSRDATCQSVDGDKIYCTNYNGEKVLLWETETLLSKGQKSLLAKQDDLIIKAEPKFRRKPRLTQVPYHVDLLPHFEYFAAGIMQKPAMEGLKITNYHLPPSPWLENSIVPVLQSFSDNHGRFASLELSNCCLSLEDLSALTKFLTHNETITTLDLSRNNITCADSVKALAKAIKKHPVLSNVNLSYVSLGGRENIDALDKLLTACKTCDSLVIGHEDFDSECVGAVIKFLRKKHSLTSFSLVGAVVDNTNKKLLSEAIGKSKEIEKFCLHSNKLQLPGIISNKSMTSKLTHLDLSHNSLPVAGAKMMAKFLEKDSNLASLILSNNHLTVKGAKVLLPALKSNTTLSYLDLSSNWLHDDIAPIVIDLLGNNDTLRSFDLSGHKNLTIVREERRRWSWFNRRSFAIPRIDGGRYAIVKGALFNTTSIDAIVSSNHTCALKMSGCYDNGDLKYYNKRQHFEETIHKINALDVCEGKKIRFKIILALHEVDTDNELFNSFDFDTVPLEMMPYLFELLQQRIGFNGFGTEVAPQGMDFNGVGGYYGRKWNPLSYKREKVDIGRKSLSRVYDAIMSWQSLPQLFVRGPGEMPKSATTKDNTSTKPKKKTAKRKRKRKFGDTGDDDDEAWIPTGGRKRGRWIRNSETGKNEYVPPPVY